MASGPGRCLARPADRQLGASTAGASRVDGGLAPPTRGCLGPTRRAKASSPSTPTAPPDSDAAASPRPAPGRRPAGPHLPVPWMRVGGRQPTPPRAALDRRWTHHSQQHWDSLRFSSSSVTRGWLRDAAPSGPGQEWDFLRPDGRLIPDVWPTPETSGAAPTAGSEIEPDACIPEWDGTSLDCNWIIDSLLQLEGLPRPAPSQPVDDPLEGCLDGDAVGLPTPIRMGSPRSGAGFRAMRWSSRGAGCAARFHQVPSLRPRRG